MHQYPRNDKDKDLIWEAFLKEGGPQPPRGDRDPRQRRRPATPPQPVGPVGVPSGPSPVGGTPGEQAADDPAQKLGMGAQGTPQSGGLEFDNPRYQTALDALQQQHGQFLATSNRAAYAQMIADQPGVSLPGADRNQAIADISNWLLSTHPDIPESTQPSIDSEMLSEDAKEWALLQDEEDPDILDPEELVVDEENNVWTVIQHNIDTNEVDVVLGEDPNGTERNTFNRTQLRRLDDPIGLYPGGDDPDAPHSSIGDTWDPQGTRRF